MLNENPGVSIVIVNYNGINDTIECLDSLRKTAYHHYEIIVADNGSTDGSLQILERRDDIKLIKLDENYGFCQACNIGLKHAKYEYICFLNNDVVVDKNWLQELVNTMQDPRIGETFSSFFDYSERFNNDDNLARIKRLRSGSHTLLGYLIPFNFFPDYINTGLDASACCCMYKRDIIDKPFDRDYFIYFEDVYLAWKIRLMGYEIKRSPFSLIYHKQSRTTGKRRNLSIFQQEKNRIMNLLIFYSRATLFKIFPLIIMDSIKKILIIFTYLLIDRQRALSLLKAYMWIILNSRKILDKREIVQSSRKVDDPKIVSLLSYRWTDKKGPVADILNTVFYKYCKTVGLRTYDINR